MEYTIEDGKKLIQFARANIEHFLQTGSRLSISKELSQTYAQKGGAFVTLNKIIKDHDTDLRGCIGMILPIYPLIETIQNVSVSSSVEDPRFPQVKIVEMDRILIEISLLSIPEKIKVSSAAEYTNQIVIGRDGLIISRGGRRGLLLPQVPIEHGRNWDVKTFLEHTCEKAFLSPNAWQDLSTTSVERFTATIFEEITPRGDIKQKKIGE